MYRTSCVWYAVPSSDLHASSFQPHTKHQRAKPTSIVRTLGRLLQPAHEVPYLASAARATLHGCCCSCCCYRRRYAPRSTPRASTTAAHGSSLPAAQSARVRPGQAGVVVLLLRPTRREACGVCGVYRGQERSQSDQLIARGSAIASSHAARDWGAPSFVVGRES